MILQRILALAITSLALQSQGDLRALCLQKSDVPAGFVAGTSHSVKTAEVARALGRSSAAFTHEFGAVQGYQTAFQRQSQTGLLFLGSTVLRFRSEASAQGFDAAATSGAKRAVWEGAHFVAVPNIRIGQHPTEFSATTIYAHHPLYKKILLYFNRGELSCTFLVVGLARTFPQGAVTTLAHLVDTRMAAAARAR